jgi:hypothetical protein
MAVYVTRGGERVSPPLVDEGHARAWLTDHGEQGDAITADDGDDPLMTAAQVGSAIGWQPKSWRAEVTKGRGPAPDDADDADGRHPMRRTPRWRLSTVKRYIDSRPGRGNWTSNAGAKARKQEEGK